MSGLGGVLEPLRIKNKELVQLASSALVDWVIVAVRQAVQQFGTRLWTCPRMPSQTAASSEVNFPI